MSVTPADTALQMHANLIGFCERNQPIDVDIADVAGLSIEDGASGLRGSRLAALRQPERALPKRHELVDDQLGLTRDPIHDVVDADGVGNVVDEVDQPSHADQGEHHRPRHGRDRHERMRQRAGGGQCRHAVGERPEEDAKRSLRGAVPDEADQDARRELRRCKRERHQQDREHDRHHRHDRGRDAAEDYLRYTRVLVRREKSARNPAADLGNRLFQRREYGPRDAQHHGDSQRPNEKAAAERVHRGTEEDRQPLKHSDPQCPLKGH